MKCPHLLIGHHQTCHSLDRPYLPSLFELNEYCTVLGHRMCPFYLGYVAGGAPGTGGNMIMSKGGPRSDEHPEA